MYPAVPCSCATLIMVLRGLAAQTRIYQSQLTFNSQVLFQPLKTKIYVSMRAKDPEQEIAQQNRLNDQNNSFTPFVFEVLLCKFIYRCLFITPTQGNHMKVVHRSAVIF